MLNRYGSLFNGGAVLILSKILLLTCRTFSSSCSRNVNSCLLELGAPGRLSVSEKRTACKSFAHVNQHLARNWAYVLVTVGLDSPWRLLFCDEGLQHQPWDLSHVVSAV